MKKGFTLIELLAVIVILAIIALISTPIVLSIIEDTKESATLRSAEFYLNVVEQSIMKKKMDAGGNFSPNTCVVQTDGNLLCDGTDTLEVEVNGEVPSSGTITFDKGKITDVELTLSNKVVTQNNKGELILGEPQKSICKLIDGEANAIGSKYQCKVKDNMEEGFEDGYYFFVLSHNTDGTTNLIMERNMYYDEDNDVGVVATSSSSNVAWYSTTSDHSYGPVIAMTYLHNATKDWNNIPNMIMNYEDENINSSTQQKGTNGYGSIVTTGTTTIVTSKTNTETLRIENLKTRLPRYDEVYGTGKCLTYTENGNQYGSCPLWLVNYTNSYSAYPTSNGKIEISGIYGYWTLSSYADYSSYAWFVRYHGYVHYIDVDRGSHYGTRPVITLEI